MIINVFKTILQLNSSLPKAKINLYSSEKAKHSIMYSNTYCKFCTIIDDKSNNKNQKQYEQHLNKLMSKYPYCILPKIQNIKQQMESFTDQTKNNLTSFQALFTMPENQKKLIQIESDLIGISENSKKLGQQIFTKFHNRKLQKYVNQINKHQNLANQNFQTKKMALQIMCNLRYSKQLEFQAKKILNSSITNNVVLQSLYIKLQINCNFPYIHLIQDLFNQLKSEINDSNQQQTLEACKYLITIQNFQQILPRNLIDFCLQKFKSNFCNLSATDLWMIIKIVYNYKSNSARSFIEQLSQNILKASKGGEGSQLHIPLVHKVIKYRSKLGLQNYIFQSVINSNAERFQTIFHEKKKLNKQTIMSIISQKSSQQLPADFKIKFREYILKSINQYAQAQQVDQIQLIRDLKLFIKYTNNLTNFDIEKIQKDLIEKISPKFQEQSSEDLKYFIFLAVFRNFNKQAGQNFSAGTIQFFKSQGKPLLNLYHNYCLEGINQEYYQRLVNICYQVYRFNLMKEIQIPNIFSYQLKTIHLSPQCYNNWLYLFKKTPFSKSNKLEAFEQLKKDLQAKLNRGIIGIKSIYTLIDALNRIDYDSDRYVYIDIQKGIAKQLQKILNRNVKQLPLPKDIWFLKETLVQKNRCSQKFKHFIIETNKNHQLIQANARDYVKLQADWINMKQNRKRNQQSKQTIGKQYVTGSKKYVK